MADRPRLPGSLDDMFRRLALLTGAAALVASCGGADSSPGEPSGGTVASSPTTATATTVATTGTGATASSAPTEPSPGTTGALVPEELDFTAGLVGGGEFTGADLTGRDTVFWFWAPWCPTCAAASSDVLAAVEAYPEVAFVGVAGLSSDAASMEQFVADHGVGGFDQIADTSGHVYTRFGVVQQHTFAFVSADGEVAVVPAYGRDVDIAALVDEQFG